MRHSSRFLPNVNQNLQNSFGGSFTHRFPYRSNIIHCFYRMSTTIFKFGALGGNRTPVSSFAGKRMGHSTNSALVAQTGLEPISNSNLLIVLSLNYRAKSGASCQNRTDVLTLRKCHNTTILKRHVMFSCVKTYKCTAFYYNPKLAKDSLSFYFKDFSKNLACYSKSGAI